jgi:acetolactate synthase-1/2/3 large subunit
MALGAADLVLILGAPLDFRLGYGRPPTFAEDARVVMIDCDAAELGRNRPLELALVADIGVVLRQALDVVPPTMRARLAPWLASVRARETESRSKLERFCASDETPISHYRLAAEIARVVGPDTTVVGDGGDVVGCASRIVPLHRPGQWLDPGPLGCLGVGPSFALTAKLLRPDQRVVLIAGDGALGLNAMELETAVRFKLPLVCVVGNDGGWGQIRNPQLSFYGEARAVATSLPATRFDLLAEALGARGALVTEPDDIRPALDKAIDSGEVWCINVLLDPAAYRKTGTVSMAI